MFDVDKELCKIWNHGIKGDFIEKMIQTEGDLLCSWYHHLRPLVEEQELIIRCQTMQFSKEIGIPDVFLWDKSGSPLVIMELKLKGSPPKWRKREEKKTDFEKLWLFSLSKKNPPKRGYFCMIIPDKYPRRSHRETYDFQPKGFFRELIGKGSRKSGLVDYWGTGDDLEPLERMHRFPPFLDSEGCTEEEWEKHKKGFRELDFSYGIEED